MASDSQARSPRGDAGAGGEQIERLKALANPLRIRILEQLAKSPMTVSEVAAALGEPRTKLYRHVAVLVRQRFISVASKRKVSGIFEKTYETKPGAMVLDQAVSAAEKSEYETALEAGLAAGFEQTRREIRGAIQVGRIDVTDEEGPTTLMGLRGYMHLTEQQAEEFAQRLQRQLKELEGSVAGGEEKTDRYGFTMVFHAAAEPPTEGSTE